MEQNNQMNETTTQCQQLQEPKQHGGFYKFWRVVYPPIIFIAMQIVVSMVAGIVFMAQALAKALPGMPDMMAITAEITEFVMNNAMLFMLISNALCLPLFVFLYLRQRKGRLKAERPAMRISDIGLIFAVSILANIFISTLMETFNIVQYFPDYEQLMLSLSGGALWIQLLSVGLVAPIVEEVLLRGVVFGRLRGYMRLLPALLVQALIFGLLHMNILQGLYAFLIALLFGYVYAKYGRLLLCILAHIVFNMTSLVLAALLEGVEINPVPVLAVSAVLLAVVLWRMLKKPLGAQGIERTDTQL